MVIKSDSQLVVGQVNVTYEKKVPCLAKYLEKVKRLIENFELEIISQSKNNHVDSLPMLASMKMFNVNQLLIQSIVLIPLIEKNKSICIDKKESWMHPMKAY